MSKKVGVILNPVAGKKRGKVILADLLEGLCRQEMDLSVFVTTGRGDAARAAERYGRDCDLVCCVGGDGTLNETISGLMRLKKRTPLCYVPAGSTNDFAQSLGISSDLNQTLEMVRGRRLTRVDLGSFDERYFTYIASFGLFTRASYSADQTVKNVIGHLAYVLAGARELQDLGKTYKVKVEWERGIIEGSFIFGGVANTTSLGGIFHLPKKHVSLDDGRFELLLIREPRTVDDLIRTVNMMNTGSFDGEQVVFVQTSYARITSDQPISYCLDGEYAGDREQVVIENHRKALCIYARPKRGFPDGKGAAEGRGATDPEESLV